MTEAQWRFLHAITEQVAPARIVELRLFPSIRQGGVESGVAVVAAEEVVVANRGTGSVPGEAAVAPDGEGVAAAADHGPVVAGGGDGAADEIDSEIEIESPARGAPPDREVTLHTAAESHHSIAGDSNSPLEREGPPSEDRADLHDPHHHASALHVHFAYSEPHEKRGERTVLRTAAADGLDPLPQADGDNLPPSSGNLPQNSPDAHPADATGDPGLDTLLELAMADAVSAAAPRHRRYRVLAARYRLTLKGPDRGRWQFDLTHEADAPLDTIERVARGVARRAGDDGEPELYAADTLGSILAHPWWSPTA